MSSATVQSSTAGTSSQTRVRPNLHHHRASPSPHQRVSVSSSLLQAEARLRDHPVTRAKNFGHGAFPKPEERSHQVAEGLASGSHWSTRERGVCGEEEGCDRLASCVQRMDVLERDVSSTCRCDGAAKLHQVPTSKEKILDAARVCDDHPKTFQSCETGRSREEEIRCAQRRLHENPGNVQRSCCKITVLEVERERDQATGSVQRFQGEAEVRETPAGCLGGSAAVPGQMVGVCLPTSLPHDQERHRHHSGVSPRADSQGGTQKTNVCRFETPGLVERVCTAQALRCREASCCDDTAMVQSYKTGQTSQNAVCGGEERRGYATESLERAQVEAGCVETSSSRANSVSRSSDVGAKIVPARRCKNYSPASFMPRVPHTKGDNCETRFGSPDSDVVASHGSSATLPTRLPASGGSGGGDAVTVARVPCSYLLSLGCATRRQTSGLVQRLRTTPKVPYSQRSYCFRTTQSTSQRLVSKTERGFLGSAGVCCHYSENIPWLEREGEEEEGCGCRVFAVVRQDAECQAGVPARQNGRCDAAIRSQGVSGQARAGEEKGRCSLHSGSFVNNTKFIVIYNF